MANFIYPEGGIAIFCKAPIPGQVKTRLQPVLSATEATALHTRLANQTLTMATQSAMAPVQLWCAPDDQHPYFVECGQRFPVSLQTQVGADLGARMHYAFQTMLQRCAFVVLLGTDCPGLHADHLNAAINTLRQYDVVLIAAEDGGYVLIAGKQSPPCFCNIDWGSDTVLAQTLCALESKGLSYKVLGTLSDIDRPEDLTLMILANIG